MARNVSIRLTDEDYEKLMKIEGETRSDKIRKLLGGEENYFTKHMNMKSDFTKYTLQQQTMMAIGILVRKLYEDHTPEKILKDYIPKADKNNILPLYKRLSEDIIKKGEEKKYEDLQEFIGIGLLDYKGNEIDDPGFYRVIGETLANKFVL